MPIRYPPTPFPRHQPPLKRSKSPDGRDLAHSAPVRQLAPKLLPRFGRQSGTWPAGCVYNGFNGRKTAHQSPFSTPGMPFCLRGAIQPRIRPAEPTCKLSQAHQQLFLRPPVCRPVAAAAARCCSVYMAGQSSFRLRLRAQRLGLCGLHFQSSTGCYQSGAAGIQGRTTHARQAEERRSLIICYNSGPILLPSRLRRWDVGACV